MKVRFAFSVILSLLIIALCACAPQVTVTSTGGPTIEEAQAVSSFDKMRIAVAKFENKTGYMVTEGMTDMVVSALFNTNKFIVLERENLDIVLQEQKLSNIGVIDEKTSIPAGLLEGAEFLVLGALTEFEPDYKGVKTPLGGAKTSHLALDLRIVDSKTARIVSSVTVKGDATDATISTGVLKYIGAGPLASGLSLWSKTPMDGAIRLCLDKAVDYIVTHSLKKGVKK